MANKAGPRIVASGLLFGIDAAFSLSYSGTGLTVNGLVSGIGATLVNGVTYSSANNGFFSFDGSNDFLNVANPSSLQISTGTICVWCRTSSPGSSYRGIVAKQSAYGLFYVDSVLSAYDWSTGLNRSTGVNIADGSWKYITFTFQNGVTNGSNIYINASNVLTTTYTINTQTSNLFIGAEANAGQHANCQIAQVLIYNRALTASEISQNYNSMKKRFGL